MIGIKTTTLLALSALAFTAAVSLRAEDRMRAGLWEITSTVDGKPAGPSHNTCYTPAMVALGNSSAKTLREDSEKQSIKSGCTLKDFKMDGTTISMTQVCGARTFQVVVQPHEAHKAVAAEDGHDRHIDRKSVV